MVTNQILQEMRISQCTKCEMVGIIVKSLDGLQVVEIMVMVTFTTNYFCQLQHISDGIAQFDATQFFTMTSAGIVIKMIAHIEFNTDPSVFNSDFDILKVYQTCKIQIDVSFNPNTMCPYITMDKNEYMDYIEATLVSTDVKYNTNTTDNDNNSNKDNLLPGFFELKTDHGTLLAGCVEHIWPKYGNSVSCHSPFTVLLILLCTMLVQSL